MHAHKLVIGFWLLIISLFITPAAFAQASTPSAIPVAVSATSPIYTDLLVHNMFHTFSCLAVGQSVIGQPCLNYVQGVPVLSQANFSGGTLGAITGLIGGLYQNPPVRTYESLASLGETLGLVKEAKAQVRGSGAGVLQPIQTLWQVSRNISYVIMIIIFVIIGLMVMFRQKINPQTVITAQAAIPGLVIGLILITFSYFLAGLISDTAFIGTNMVGYYFSAVQTKPPQDLVQQISDKSVLRMFGDFIGMINSGQIQQALDQVYSSLTSDIQSKLSWFAAFLAFQTTGSLGGLAGPYALIAGPIIGLVSGALVKVAPTQILGFFLQFVVIAALIYAMLKLLLRLINSYLTIIFLTISAPFQFLFAALPGRQGIATGWILNMLANILVFPAVIAVFYFVAFILGRNVGPFTVSHLNQEQKSAFISTVKADETTPVNSVVGDNTFPLFGNLNLEFIRLLIAFGALIALPTIPDIIIRTVGKASQAGQMIGQEISGSTRAGQGYASQFGGRITQAGQSVSTGIVGESMYQISQRTGGPVRVPTKPGLWQVFKK